MGGDCEAGFACNSKGVCVESNSCTSYSDCSTNFCNSTSTFCDYCSPSTNVLSTNCQTGYLCNSTKFCYNCGTETLSLVTQPVDQTYLVGDGFK